MALQKFGEAAKGDDPFLSARKEIIRDDIARRLRHICSHLSEADFKQLVDSMTEQKLKGERRTSL
jgi:hypothetical protein